MYLSLLINCLLRIFIELAVLLELVYPVFYASSSIHFSDLRYYGCKYNHLSDIIAAKILRLGDWLVV
jgi:hypothetical protein